MTPCDSERLAEISGRFIAEGRAPEEADARAKMLCRAETLNPRSLEDIRMMDLKREWIVDALMTPGLVILAAKKGNWKSLLALQCGYAVASGAAFLGRATTKGPCLYLALELDELAMSERAQKIGPCPQGLDVMTAFERGTNAIADLEALIVARGYRLIVVDMLQAILPGGTDGNAYDDVTPFLLTLRRLGQKYKAAILCLMHSPKSSRDDFADAVLGSTGFAGQADNIIVLERKRGSDTADLFATGNHGKDTAFRIRIDEDLRLSLDGLIPVSRDSQAKEEVLDALTKLGPDGGSAKTIGESIGRGEDATRKILERLMVDRKAERVRRGLDVIRGSVPDLIPKEDDSPF